MACRSPIAAFSLLAAVFATAGHCRTAVRDDREISCLLSAAVASSADFKKGPISCNK